ncbi:hypothetical protein BCV69DRAFT_279800 [Microstroma glucosiphilum]|uniref:Uncharacterized protein n=1 Tax=Pseudomicrostroma glucosiphilum TaxID=1684307 RepID=A0A316UHU1_9BASI|nr:hypothetical protein BCV69DRAFT_279800 [Pseudomicrostroma glucosiphilum]PWN23891.1 hypothetical protein BCV69DRAFT_279800 [Pseudomicrostroma glucosiphilum]
MLGLTSTRTVARRTIRVVGSRESGMAQVAMVKPFSSLSCGLQASQRILPCARRLAASPSASLSLAPLHPRRHLFTSPLRWNTTAEKPAETPQPEVLATYTGPMAATFYRLKLFSLGSLTLASAFTPVFLLAASDLSLAGRLGLSATAIVTSVVSTALVAWIGKPYVGRMSLMPAPADGKGQEPIIEAYTITWRIRTLQTRIYQPSLIRPTSRPFASWELPENPGGVFHLPQSSSGDGSGANEDRILVSETFDAKSGKVVGKWWAERVAGTASNSGKGAQGEFKEEARCFAEGKPVRHFQVHEELLGEEWRILG